MKVLGLITEYNPFHNGHLYHLEQAKKLSGADYVICVMSGNFIQRGEPAIVNKWARTKMSLAAGIDLVIELPVVYAMASAEYFAYGAVKLLDSTGIVNYLCFGSESGEISELNKISEIFNNEPGSFKNYLKTNLEKGLSFAASRESALMQYFNEDLGQKDNICSIINESNNILGIEYLKAIKKLRSNITPLTIPRIANSYNTSELSGTISSATAIRKNLKQNIDLKRNIILTSSLPETTLKILEGEFKSGKGPVFPEKFESIILSALRTSSKHSLRNLQYVTEGLENRIKSAAINSRNLGELITKIVTKRYTRTRIQRILFSTFTSMVSKEFNEFNKYGGPQYIRVLGFSEKGQKLLSLINQYSSLPVIIKTADFKNSCNPLLKRMLEIESVSTDNYVLGYNNPEYRVGGQEFTQSVIRTP